ncbi:hypothetical protein LY76DRAFT_79086 [Colletotrichum caudatum]|nr:hypothetical protein LY76DRAFT_79086 [Colletotrichum caudatum]
MRAGEWDDIDFATNLVRPCCELLGPDADGTPLKCRDAVRHAERELHAAINSVDFVVRYHGENAESLRIAVKLVTSAPCFGYISRLDLFNMRLQGACFNEDDKKLWAGVFGEPFEDEAGGK